MKSVHVLWHLHIQISSYIHFKKQFGSRMVDGFSIQIKEIDKSSSLFLLDHYNCLGVMCPWQVFITTCNIYYSSEA